MDMNVALIRVERERIFMAGELASQRRPRRIDKGVARRSRFGAQNDVRGITRLARSEGAFPRCGDLQIAVVIVQYLAGRSHAGLSSVTREAAQIPRHALRSMRPAPFFKPHLGVEANSMRSCKAAIDLLLSKIRREWPVSSRSALAAEATTWTRV